MLRGLKHRLLCLLRFLKHRLAKSRPLSSSSATLPSCFKCLWEPKVFGVQHLQTYNGACCREVAPSVPSCCDCCGADMEGTEGQPAPWVIEVPDAQGD